MSLLSGRKILILGVANERSIAWGIASELHKQGAELAFTYVNEAIEKRLRPLAESIGCEHVFPCDVQNDDHFNALFKELQARWGTLDGLVHSVAFADGQDLKTRFSNTSREGFKLALDVSAYSLIAASRGALEMMKERGGSILTLSYLGAERVVTNYNVMGVAKAALESSVRYLAADLGQHAIRVNALSPGPIKTLAASGIPGFRDLLTAFAEKSPLRRNVTQDDVAKAALFYMSDLSSGITGEVNYVDCGYNILGI